MVSGFLRCDSADFHCSVFITESDERVVKPNRKIDVKGLNL